jgi:hypothetical protein
MRVSGRVLLISLCAVCACDAIGGAFVNAENLSCAHQLNSDSAVWYACNVRASAAGQMPALIPGILDYQPQATDCGLLFCAATVSDAEAQAVRVLGRADEGLQCVGTTSNILNTINQDQGNSLFPMCLDPGTGGQGSWGNIGDPCWFGNGFGGAMAFGGGPTFPIVTPPCCEPATCEPAAPIGSPGWETNIGQCCLGPEEACQQDSDCCSFIQGLQGCLNGMCDCLPNGSPCTTVTQCCSDSDLCSGPNGMEGPDATCCSDFGEGCVQDAECCSRSCTLNACD